MSNFIQLFITFLFALNFKNLDIDLNYILLYNLHNGLKFLLTPNA